MTCMPSRLCSVLEKMSSDDQGLMNERLRYIR